MTLVSYRNDPGQVDLVLPAERPTGNSTMKVLRWRSLLFNVMVLPPKPLAFDNMQTKAAPLYVSRIQRSQRTAPD